MDVKKYLEEHKIETANRLVSHIVELKRNTEPNLELISHLADYIQEMCVKEYTEFPPQETFNKYVNYIYLEEPKRPKEWTVNTTENSPSPEADYINFISGGVKRGKIFSFQPAEQKVRVNFYSYDSKNNPIIEVREFDCSLKAAAYFRESKHTEAFVYEYRTFNLINKWDKKGISSEGSEIQEKVSKTEGIKETEGKLYYELSWEFIEEMAKRMANNKSNKYPLFNWKKNINVEDLKQAINRHHIEVMKGNYKDGDELLGHVVSYACNSMMLWEQLNKS